MRNAIVLLSGGVDSTTALAVARSQGFNVYALSFAYGQRHKSELLAARAIARDAGVCNHVVIEIDLRAFGRSALTDEIDVPKDRSVEEMNAEIPVTYVPARNTIFLSYALALAEVNEANDIFIGVNALDYSGYPDCRPEYITAFQEMARRATARSTSGDHTVNIHAPLIHKSKAEIIRIGSELGVDFSHTVSCYQASEAGLACGHCDACILRRQGFKQNGLPDPTRYVESENGGLMSYSVKEIYYTLQGEGAYAGRPAVFCRFTGCNLWTGREVDRHKAICQFCDTDFVGTNGPQGGVYQSAADLSNAIDDCWPSDEAGEWIGNKLVVFTGGEPLLQLNSDLVEALHVLSFSLAIETNGTILPPPGIDWICVSPKANAPLVLTSGDELKLVYPQTDVDPARYTCLDFHRFFLQPMDGPRQHENTRLAAKYCLEHPRWELSLQTHKLIGLP